MKKFRSIMMMGFVLLIVMLSKPAMAVGIGSFNDISNFSIVIGANMYTLDYANDSSNEGKIGAAIIENTGNIYIKTDDSGWIRNSDGVQVSKDSVDISTIKYNNGQEIAVTVPVTSIVTKIQVDPTTITGTNTATFAYKILDQTGLDITKTIPVSDIYFANEQPEGSTIVLDPTTGIGKITFSSPIDVNTLISISLIYKNGVTGTTVPAKISKINIDATLTKTGTNTATFKYKMLDKDGLDITKTIPASQIDAITSVSSTVFLDASTSTGTITYNSLTDINTSINVTLTDKTNGATVNVVMPAPAVETDAPKVNKIIVTSTELTTSGDIGYASYSIYDQYGNDITNTSLGNNVIFSSSVGQVKSINGSLTITANEGIKYSMLNSVAITGSDSITGVSTSATLSVTIAGSTQVGTLSNILLTTLTNVDGKTLTAGDTSDVFYAGYVALDVNGKATTNYDLMAQGLILTGDHMLTTSTPYVVAQLVRDPSDGTKGLIKVTATSDTIAVDMPIVITAITASKTSQLSTTLKKQSSVVSFTLAYPSETISSGESVLIPFIALDQNGKIITKFSELNGIVTLTGATLEENSDGTASVKSNKIYTNGTDSIHIDITAITKTGMYSTITIVIK